MELPEQSGPNAEIQSKNESSSYQNFKDSSMEGMCPSKYSLVGIQETLTESNRCISTSGLVWESLGPNASIEFHPGQEDQGRGKGPRPWQGAHASQHPSQKQLPAGRLLVPRQPPVLRRLEGQREEFSSWQTLNWRAEKEGVYTRGRKERREEAHGRHVNNLAMADPTRANLRVPLPVLGSTYSRDTL